MPRFFVPPFEGETLTLAGEDGRHAAKSLRLRAGEEVEVSDGEGSDYRCAVAGSDPEQGTVALRVLERRPNASELPCRVGLYQALPKGDKLEQIVQKAVELGVNWVTPVLTSRCISRPDPKSMEKKRERLQKIALEAAKQSGRGLVPEIRPLLTFSEALGEMEGNRCPILFYERADAPLGERLSSLPEEISIMVGAEGGFSPEEAAEAQGRGIALCTMGRRILRCETAPLYALSVIGYLYENRGEKP